MAPHDKKEITKSEVEQHNKPDDMWVIINNEVYDLTKFRAEHPGGEEVLVDVAGKEATKEFKDAGHSKEAKQMMKKYYIGELAAKDRKAKPQVKPRDVGIAVGAVILGFAVVYLIKRYVFSRN